MADIFSKEKRSKVMAAIKGKNTAVELLVFRYLRRNKVYFQKHYQGAPGSPDIALPRKKKAVFIDGDFWHGKTYDKVRAKYGTENYWTKKIDTNMRRDAAVRSTLLEKGWKVFTVWESDLIRKKTQDKYLAMIRRFLAEGR